LDGARVARSDVLELLPELVEKSLVLAEPTADGMMRYRLLETLRQYAAERLAERGEAEAVQRQHATHYVTVVETAEPNLRGPEQATWLQRLDIEHDNFRAAIQWAVDHGAAEEGLQLGGAGCSFSGQARTLQRGTRAPCPSPCDRRAKHLLPPRATARAKVLHGAALLALQQMDLVAARAFFEESLGIRRALGLKAAMACSLNNLGIAARLQGDFAAARFPLEEGMALFRELGDQWGVGVVLNNLAQVAQSRHDNPLARELFLESLALSRSRHDLWGVANRLNNLPEALLDAGEVIGVGSLLEESLAINVDLDDPRAIA
jgi:predicted ATPase